jgi:hypothetical protein
MSWMIRHLLFIVTFLTITTLLAAQSNAPAGSNDILYRLQQESLNGQVRLEVDSLLVANYYRLLEKNRKEVTGVPGYRIRIFSESGVGAKEQQQRVRARFLSLYPDIDAYYRYDDPYFKVYVGDCRTKSEAIKLYDKIVGDFPNLIRVPDYVNINTNKE